MSQQQVIKETYIRSEDAAYANGWEDGRFGPLQLFVDNPNIAGWAGYQERLAYYRGHRDGRRFRRMLAHGDSA